MGTLKPQSNGQLYSNTVIWYSEEGPGRAPLLAVPNATAHPSTASVSYQLHIIKRGTIIASAP